MANLNRKTRWWLPADPRIGMWAFAILMLSMFLLTLSAWITHIVVCIQQEAYLLLIAGAFGFPIGVMHGMLILTGVV